MFLLLRTPLIDRRVSRLDVKLDEEDYGNDLVLAVDASGILDLEVQRKFKWVWPSRYCRCLSSLDAYPSLY